MAKEYKNNLSDILNSLDKKDYNVYSKMSEDQKKEFQPFVLMRYLSSVPDNEPSMYSLVAVNEYVNKHFWDLSSDKELQSKLLSAAGLGKKSYHQWISNKSVSANALHSFVIEIFDNKNWHCNKVEIELFCKLNNLDDINNLCSEYGKTKDEQKKIVEQYKKIYM
jgi:hypothetical protein